jgi:hypothetical protein
MRAPPRERGQVLILLGIWLFFGGGAASALVVYDRSPKETKKVVKRVIMDVARRDVILADISQWQKSLKRQDKEVSAGRKELLEIMRRKEATRSEVEPIMAKLERTFLEMDRNFLDVRFRVKEQVTSAEWAQMVARPDR